MPIFRSFSVQFFATLIILAAVKILHGPWHTMLAWSLVQGVIAAFISIVVRQPRWWWLIHLAFMPAVMFTLQWHIPSSVYMVILLVLGLVFWGTVRGDVPLFLSSEAVANALVDILQVEEATQFADFGAGVGSVVIPVARQMPALQVEAWERAPIPWWICSLRAKPFKNIQVFRRSFWDCDLSQFDVLFVFLSPLAMPRLAEKARLEMPKGALLVSSSFPVPEWKPEFTQQLEDNRKTILYCYRIT